MQMTAAGPPSRVFDKKRTIILLRSVVVISTSYLILFGQPILGPASITYILALILSNFLLASTPREWFHEPRFSATLLLGDTAAVLVGLYLTVGCFSQDFLIIYFFTIFLTTATSSVAQIAVGAAMISSLYGYWLWLTAAHAVGAAEWLRLPFFFIVAVFYAYVTEETKHERYRREQAERESDHLQFLLNLGETFVQRRAVPELVGQIGSLVEAAFPRLRCTVRLEPVVDAGNGRAFFFRSHERTFGALQVSARDGVALSPEEGRFCAVVAMVVADALYTAEQTGMVEDGVRLKEQFLATLSHELRSPLHSILGNADILAEAPSVTADGVAFESVGRLRASALRLLDLVEEMLCYTELRAGKSRLLIEPVDIRELFAELDTTMRQLIDGRPIQFACEVGPDVRLVYTDRRKFRSIVSALLSNAAKFTQRGFVRLRATCSEHGLEVAVQDSGIGLHPRDVTRIFEEFRQLDGSLTRRFDGLGLGLALAQELAATLGGRVEVESEVGRGSTFFVRLPIRSRQVAQPTAVASPIVARPQFGVPR
jgi:signal transduction histidine kinase